MTLKTPLFHANFRPEVLVPTFFGLLSACSGTIEVPDRDGSRDSSGETAATTIGAGGSGMTASSASAAGSTMTADSTVTTGPIAGNNSDAVGNGDNTGGASFESTQGMAGAAMGPDNETDPEPVPVCDAVTKVLMPSCGSSDCHRGVGIGDFGASEEQALAYVGKPPTFNVASCGLMIDPVNPERSMILTKVTGEPPYDENDCNLLMPFTGSLPQDQVDCLRSWLEQFRQ